jgi:hypothetical protein
MANGLLEIVVKNLYSRRKEIFEELGLKNMVQYVKIGLGMDALVEGYIRINQREIVNDMLIQHYLVRADQISSDTINKINTLPFNQISGSNTYWDGMVGAGFLFIAGVLLASGGYNLYKNANLEKKCKDSKQKTNSSHYFE